jgi:hypothetical protein
MSSFISKTLSIPVIMMLVQATAWQEEHVPASDVAHAVVGPHAQRGALEIERDRRAGDNAPANASLAVLWDNNIVPNGVNGRAISPPSFPNIRVADDVTFAEAIAIEEFHLNVLEDDGWNDGGEILLEVRADNGGSPGAVVATHAGPFSKMATGDQYFGRANFDYWIEGIDLILPAGTHWVGIRNPNGGGSGTNYWLTSDGGPDGMGSSDGYFSLDGGGTWSPEGAGWQHAFTAMGAGPPPASMPVDRGELVATCCSGVDNLVPHAKLDPAGFVTVLIAARDPFANGAQPDKNWIPPWFHNEFPVTPDTWNAANLGQVFGVALDDASPPNIYLTSSTVYGDFSVNAANAVTMFGPAGNGGTVYKINGATGVITTLATLPNTKHTVPGHALQASAGLGNIAYSTVDKYLYVTNMDDGIIYAQPTGPGVAHQYDHGVNGRPEEGLSVEPDIAADLFTKMGHRRVWGVAVNETERRLYYSVWWEDDGRQNTSEDNEIWSVSLNALGGFVANSARREFRLPPRVGAPLTGRCNPVSDISFSPSGAMLVAERTRYADTGTRLVGGANDAHFARVLEFTGTHLSWVASPLNKYAVGNSVVHQNSAGGVVADCDENVWATGDALHFAPGDNLYGLERIPAGGNAVLIPTTLHSVLIDLNGNTAEVDKTEIGDVAIRRSCCAPPPRNMVAWLPFDEPTGCQGATTHNALALADGVLAGGACLGYSGKIDGAVCFGDGGYVDVPFYSHSFFGLSLPDAFTIDAWFEPHASPAPLIQTIVDKRQSVPGGWRGFRFYLASGVPTLEVSDGASCTQTFSAGSAALLPFLWHFLGVTYDRASNSCTFVIDGICTTVTGSCTPTTLYSASPLRIGDSFFGPPESSVGCIDEVEVFARQLSCGELQAIYAAGEHGKCKEFCQLYWQKAFSGGEQTIRVPVRLCNGTSAQQTYSLSFAPVPGCGNLPWPGIPAGWSANPPGPNYTVDSGGCAIVWITMPRPPFTPSVTEVACYEVCMTNGNTGKGSCCTGEVRWSGPIRGSFPWLNAGGMNPGGTGGFRDAPLDPDFTGPPLDDWVYLAIVVGPDMEPDTQSVRLNGLPPGTPVMGVVQLSDEGMGTVPLTAAFVRDEPMQPFTVILQVDLNDDGEFESLDSIGIMQRLLEHAPAGCGTRVRDDVEFYPIGEVCSYGAWEEWVDSIDVCGEVTVEEAFSGDRSIKIVGNVGGSNGQGDDIVQRFDIEGGRHTLSMMTFVPGGGRGNGYVVLLSNYPEPFDWAVVLRFDANGNLVRDSDHPGINTPMVKGEWIPLVIDIDLDADLVDVSYNGIRFITGKRWTEGGGELRFEALDLYAGEPGQNGTTGMYFDDIVLQSVCEVCVRDPEWACDGDVDGNGIVNPVDHGLVQAAFGSDDEADLCQYDIDCNGVINPVDSGLVQSLFGSCDPPRDACR